MANKRLSTLLTLLVGAFFSAQTAFADSSVSQIAIEQGKTAVKIGATVDASSLLNAELKKLTFPADSFGKRSGSTGIRAIVGGINFTSADVDNTMVPFATKNGATLQNLFHDGGEWPNTMGNPTNDDGRGSGESQAKEIYDYDGNKHYPKACLRYIGSHCYIFVPVMFFPTLPKTLSSSEAETPKAYAEWNMSWPHNPRLKYSPDDTTSGCTVLEPRFILGSDKATAKLTLARIADEFDNNIYPKIREYLGSEPDIDGDPKIFIFLDDIRDTNNTHLGYFYAANQFSRSSQPLSNEKEILFLDIYRFYQNKQDVLDTAAHEFTHMVLYNQAYSIVDNKLVGLATWLEEGITQYMQYLYSGKYTSNLDEFIKNPDTVLVDDRTTTWQGSSPFANYGASFLWTYYTVEKYGYSNVSGFLQNVVRAKVDGGVGNYDSALKARNTTMATVFKDWVVANYLDKYYKNDGVTLLNDGKWGYKADNDHDTANDIGYTLKLPCKPTETYVLKSDMNTRAGTVSSWAGDCIVLTGNNGNLNIAFDGNDNGNFACAVVKRGSAVDTTCEFMNLNTSQSGNMIVQNYGTTGAYETIMLIPMVASNYNYEKLSYVYSGSFDDLKVGIFPNPIFENFLHIVVRTEKEFSSEPRVQMTFGGKQGYLTMSPINNSTYMTNYPIATDGEGTIVCTGTNKNGVILSNTLNFSASYYKSGSSGSLMANYAKVDIPAGAMNNGTVILSESDNTISYTGLTRMSKNVDLALPVEESSKDLQITIPVNSSVSVDNSKAGLYRTTASGQKWVGPVEIADGKAKGNVGFSGSLFVAVDDTAPVISSEAEARGKGRYAVKVTDAGSGINASSVKVLCNGKEVSASANENEVMFDTSDMKAGNEVFEIEVKDNAGNSSRATVRAVAGSTGIKQITAYPNPAKNGRSVIRATVNGVGVVEGSVKIYDVSGHKVKEGVLVNNGGTYEYEWDTTNKKGKVVANGVYYADVKVNFDGCSHKQRIKIAVLK